MVDQATIKQHQVSLSKKKLGQNIVHAEFHRDINEFYDLSDGEELGRGISGSVSTVRHKDTGMIFACKTLDKMMVSENELAALKQEIAFMATLDHPNILRLYEYFETKHTIFLVMHLCKGGELLDRLHAQKGSRYTEKQACKYVKEMLGAIRYCHENNIVHRDLKLENFLLDTDDSNSSLKLIDFGLSAYFEKSKLLQKAVGTPYYVAPEVLRNAYTSACDIWSLGVISYMLVSGLAPFWGKTDVEIFRRVRNGTWSFEPRVFKKVSPQAKGFIKSCLNINYEERPTAAQLQDHEWFQMIQDNKIEEVPLEIVDNLMDFRNKTKFVKISMEVIAHTLNPTQVRELKDLFIQCDLDKSGEIKTDEFREIISKHEGFSVDDEKMIFDSVDVEGNGTIKYHEFLAATLSHQSLTDENLRIAFEKISNRTGYITPEDLGGLLGADGNKETISSMLTEVGLASDANIDINMFRRIMKGENAKGEGRGSMVDAPFIKNRYRLEREVAHVP